MKALITEMVFGSVFVCGLAACGGTVEVKADGEATVRHVLDVQFTACESLPPQEKVECIQDMLTVLKAAAEAANKEE